MFETESRDMDESVEPFSIVSRPSGDKPDSSNLAIRRRIERLRELHRLRQLLDDPDFDDLS
ncbi:hypothetical protein ABC977_08760 [Thioalkalicoccus limnaeus]|uniref:Uncharacterized protein n=1 Tax=Thioalkalicoccus limnaeus TaxID=120681 RepID=A0ABV4BGS9_9GAMM